ncbi:MAG: ABC transporter substrate-binding protein [Armatimonadetes bacterium]|nr:ABC transporter substrate-binding protein [Armatimonadota bacterium]
MIQLRQKSSLFGALLLGVALFGIGCKDKEEAKPSGTGKTGETTDTASRGNTVTGDTIKIGEYGSLTGDNSTFGISTHRGIQLAIEETNAAGGINGKKLELISEDDNSKAEQAKTVVQKLVSNEKVIAVIGEVASSRSIMAAPVCQDAKVPMVSPSSTNPKVTAIGDYIFRVCFTDDFQAVVAAQFAWDQGYKNVAVFTDVKSDYSKAFGELFAKKFKTLGGKVAAEPTYQSGDVDFKAQLATIKGATPDAVLIPGYYTEVGTIARQAREVGLSVPLFGGDGWESDQLIPGAGIALEGCFFTNHFFSHDMTEPHILSFIAAFQKINPGKQPGALDALGYDAAKVIIEALKRAKSLDSVALRDAIAETKDYQGVAGKITLDANRNARKEAVLFKIVGKEFKIFKSYRPEQVGL